MPDKLKRPDPETLLARIKEEEKATARGKLKIFLGAAPGVGKTYTMLEDAMTRLTDGIDVVAGLVETHGRKETEAMVEKLEKLQRRKVNYHGRMLEEFDIDGALKRKPGLILVDELAHTNLPNSRHTKRWQDVKELLDRGIDVYTTLNVQHIESLNDIIAQITGVTVRETVPDAMVEEANAIELIDLPPEDLLKRLQEGKVYAPEQAEVATQHFFTKGNLIALREIALRVAAERVNAQVLSYRESQEIQKTWPTTERVLVYVTPDAASAKLVRAARRMAARLNAPWIAAYVETSKNEKLSQIAKHNLTSNFKLAEQLGGETVTLQGRNVVEELVSYARDRNVTKIVVAKQMPSRFRTFFFGSFVDELIRNSGEIDIYAIQGGSAKSHRLLPIINFKPAGTWQHYLLSILMVIACTFLGFFIAHYFELSNLIMIYLLGVIFISMQGRRGPAVLASILSVLAFDFFFVTHRMSFSIPDTQYLVTFMIMLFAGLLISHLTIISKRQTYIARLKEKRASAMYALSRRLASARGVEKILQVATQHIAEVFDSQVAALLPDEGGNFIVYANYGNDFDFDDKELSVAKWVYDLGQVAGLGTQTLPFAKALYVPLLGAKRVVGVLRVFPADINRLAIPEQLHLLETFANQVALVLEVEGFVKG